MGQPLALRLPKQVGLVVPRDLVGEGRMHECPFLSSDDRTAERIHFFPR